jgi:hypothetical protein
MEDTTKELDHKFSGTTTGKNTTIKTFSSDIDHSECGVFHASFDKRYMLTIHTVKRELWSLSWPSGFITGIGNVFSNREYATFLSSFPKEVIDLLKEKFEEYRFSSSNCLLFGINNTMRLLPYKESLNYLCFPDDSYELISSLHDNSAISDAVLVKHQETIGTIIGKWLREQFAFFALVELRRKNARNTIKKELAQDEE